MSSKFNIGTVEIGWSLDHTVTRFPDGNVVFADHNEQPGQCMIAAELGMSVKSMNRTHDLTHSLLAHWLGMEGSPTLLAVAKGERYQHHEAEEAAVLAIQRWAKIAGVDLVELAKGI